MKRDLRAWKETRKRDLCLWKETYVHEKRPRKENYIHGKRPKKETYVYEKKRFIYVVSERRYALSWLFEKLYACKWKETYVHKKRLTQETYVYEKRPVYMKTDLEKRKLIHVIWIELTFEKLYACKRKETYVHEKRRTKETYVHEKRPRKEQNHPCNTYQADFREIVCVQSGSRIDVQPEIAGWGWRTTLR